MSVTGPCLRKRPLPAAPVLLAKSSFAVNYRIKAHLVIASAARSLSTHQKRKSSEIPLATCTLSSPATRLQKREAVRHQQVLHIVLLRKVGCRSLTSFKPEFFACSYSSLEPEVESSPKNIFQASVYINVRGKEAVSSSLELHVCR